MRNEPGVVSEDEEDSQGLNMLETVNYAKYKEGFYPCPTTVKHLAAGTYEPAQHNQMYGLKPVTLATDDFIPLNESTIQDVLDDITKFWQCEKEYNNLKIVHKRGILLYGSPGCGKTHIINRLNQIITSNGGIVILGHTYPSMTIAAIRLVKSVEPNKKLMVIFEDLDSLFKKYEESEFLQMLDGGLQVNNIVFVGTTNHPEILHERVTNRPSRFDLSIEVGKPTAESRRAYVTNKFKALSYNGNIEEFVKHTEGMSIAHIKEIIVAVCILGHEFKKALKRLAIMKIPPKIKRDQTVGFAMPKTNETLYNGTQ